MEFPFDVTDVLPGRITIIESKDSSSSLNIYDVKTTLKPSYGFKDTAWICYFSSNSWDDKANRKKEELENIVDSIGHASAQAQNLQAPITTLKKMIETNQQKLYIMRDVKHPKVVIGMLKVGIKRLFVCDSVGAHHEVDPVCLLDFYIHESKQRCGFGHALFDIMLKNEGITPEKLAVDRPSDKCLQFLQKHYSLDDPIPQSNNFVVYPGFLQDRPVTRPPIFLYRGKVMPRPYPNSRQKTSDSARSLESVPVCIRASGIKSRAHHSGNFLNMDNCEGDQRRKKKLLDENTSMTNSCEHKGEKDCVKESMHSYSTAFQERDDMKIAAAAESVLPPVDSVHGYSPRQWHQLQSSWNVLGVKPVDYADNSKKP